MNDFWSWLTNSIVLRRATQRNNGVVFAESNTVIYYTISLKILLA